jgi:hypothetical protein
MFLYLLNSDIEQSLSENTLSAYSGYIGPIAGFHKIAGKVIFSGVHALVCMSDNSKFQLLPVTYEKLLIDIISL